MCKWIILFFVVFGLIACSTAQKPLGSSLDITYDISDLDETKSVLENLLKQYDLTKYIFTRKIKIQTMAIPHSHPILTLNSRERKRPDYVLATFLHEQLHWYLDSKPEKTNQIISQLKIKYPKVPRGYPQASDDDESTYLHLLVNWLELRELEDIIGVAKAHEVIENKDYYVWVYKTILKDDASIGSIVKSAGLAIPGR